MATAIAVATLLAGCAASASPASTASEPAGLSKYEKGLLKDGSVSAAEYHQAVADAAKCVSKGGWKVGDPGPDGTGVIWNFQIDLPDGVHTPPPALDNIVGTCRATYLDYVEKVYLDTQAPGGAEKEKLESQFLACLSDAGITDVTAMDKQADVIKKLSDEPDKMSAGLICISKYGKLFADN